MCGCFVFFYSYFLIFIVFSLFFFFFFSSRRRHTRCLSDWSSDVCSSDLAANPRAVRAGDGVEPAAAPRPAGDGAVFAAHLANALPDVVVQLGGEGRSEERRVGKGCRSRWWACD